MAFRCTIKAGGLNNLTNARFFASSGVQWLGFRMDPLDPGSLTIEQATEVLGWVAADGLMGEFDNRSEDEVLFLAESLHLQGVQVPYSMDAGRFAEKGLRVIKRLNLTNGAIPMALSTDNPDWFLIEMDGISDEISSGGFLVQSLKHWLADYPLMITLPPDVEMIDKVLGTLPGIAINLVQGDELQPGWQEFSGVIDVLDHLKLHPEV